MSAKTFLVTYANGMKTEYTAELEHAEALANQMFGKTLDEIKEFGAWIEEKIEGEENKVVVKPDLENGEEDDKSDEDLEQIPPASATTVATPAGGGTETSEGAAAQGATVAVATGAAETVEGAAAQDAVVIPTTTEETKTE